jgi:nucleotide-binding universal stress UspA family protein
MAWELKKMLYATDFKKLSLTALEGLLEFCKLGLKEVIFLNAANFSDWKETLSQHGINVKALSEKEPSASGILNVAEREGVSLIIAHLEKGGSAIKHLIKRSTIPVIIVHKTEINKGWFEHIIFATDWSPSSENALSYLLNFKEIIKELDIVHIISEKLSVRDLRGLKHKLAETRKVCLDQGIDAEFHLYVGKIEEEIIKAAKDYEGTAIVMGATSKSTLREMFFGNLSCEMAEEAPIPVLVIRKLGE